MVLGIDSRLHVVAVRENAALPVNFRLKSTLA